MAPPSCSRPPFDPSAQHPQPISTLFRLIARHQSSKYRTLPNSNVLLEMDRKTTRKGSHKGGKSLGRTSGTSSSHKSKTTSSSGKKSSGSGGSSSSRRDHGKGHGSSGKGSKPRHPSSPEYSTYIHSESPQETLERARKFRSQQDRDSERLGRLESLSRGRSRSGPNDGIGEIGHVPAVRDPLQPPPFTSPNTSSGYLDFELRKTNFDHDYPFSRGLK